ncbi:hypothetical protein DUNSADRAFT_6869, partial [Dunaliella salina]
MYAPDVGNHSVKGRGQANSILKGIHQVVFRLKPQIRDALQSISLYKYYKSNHCRLSCQPLFLSDKRSLLSSLIDLNHGHSGTCEFFIRKG